MLADPAVRNPLAWLGLGEFAAANRPLVAGGLGFLVRGRLG
jgi:hypothetical protein